MTTRVRWKVRARSGRELVVRRAPVLALLMATGLFGITACQGPIRGSSTPVAEAPGEAAPPPRAVVHPPASVTVTPADGARKVLPSSKVTVRVTDGSLTQVKVTDDAGNLLSGTRGSDGASWTSTGKLKLDASYSASVVTLDRNGTSATSSSTFQTVKPDTVLKTTISPIDGSRVGVGMPIIVRFNADVINREAVESKLKVTTTPAVVGSWRWVGDSEIRWRPKTYWPAGTKVRLHVGLADVDAGRGVWGQKNRTVDFSIGASMISVVDVDSHTMTVRRNGEVIRTIPVTTGKPGFRTRDGIKVIIEKFRTKRMDAATLNISEDDPEYYNIEDVPYAMRVTYSGEFVHGAPWSVGSQGYANVSHGCVGMSVSNARWFYNQSDVGDVVKFVGSSRGLEPGNGWTDWNVSWSKWVAGSALT